MQKKRRRVNQTVNAIEDSAVTRNQGAHVLYAQIALDQADGKIAKLAADPNYQSCKDQLPSSEVRKSGAQDPRQDHREGQCPQRPAPRFVWTDVAPEFSLAEELARRHAEEEAQRRLQKEEEGKPAGAPATSVLRLVA